MENRNNVFWWSRKVLLYTIIGIIPSMKLERLLCTYRPFLAQTTIRTPLSLALPLHTGEPVPFDPESQIFGEDFFFLGAISRSASARFIQRSWVNTPEWLPVFSRVIIESIQLEMKLCKKSVKMMQPLLRITAKSSHIQSLDYTRPNYDAI